MSSCPRHTRRIDETPQTEMPDNVQLRDGYEVVQVMTDIDSAGWRNGKASGQMTCVRGELVALDYNNIIEAIHIDSNENPEWALREQGCLVPGGASGFKDLALAIETNGVVAEYICFWASQRRPRRTRLSSQWTRQGLLVDVRDKLLFEQEYA